jgi:hypothetical protein
MSNYTGLWLSLAKLSIMRREYVILLSQNELSKSSELTCCQHPGSDMVHQIVKCICALYLILRNQWSDIVVNKTAQFA